MPKCRASPAAQGRFTAHAAARHSPRCLPTEMEAVPPMSLRRRVATGVRSPRSVNGCLRRQITAPAQRWPRCRPAPPHHLSRHSATTASSPSSATWTTPWLPQTAAWAPATSRVRRVSSPSLPTRWHRAASGAHAAPPATRLPSLASQQQPPSSAAPAKAHSSWPTQRRRAASSQHGRPYSPKAFAASHLPASPAAPWQPGQTRTMTSCRTSRPA